MANDALLGEELAFVYSEVVNSFDNWLHLLVKRGGTEKVLIDLIQSRISQNMRTNADFYNSLAMSCDKEESYSAADNYRLISKLYGGLCR